MGGILVGILLGGCAARFSKSWHYFRPKYVILQTCFQTRPPKSIPVFRPVLWAPDLAFRQKLRHHYLDSVCKQKNSSNAFQIRIFLLLSYSFGIETISTFIHSHSTLENHTWFQTKMVRVYTCFQTKTRPGGAAHTYIACIREYPPPPPGFIWTPGLTEWDVVRLHQVWFLGRGTSLIKNHFLWGTVRIKSQKVTWP